MCVRVRVRGLMMTFAFLNLENEFQSFFRADIKSMTSTRMKENTSIRNLNGLHTEDPMRRVFPTFLTRRIVSLYPKSRPSLSNVQSHYTGSQLAVRQNPMC